MASIDNVLVNEQIGKKDIRVISVDGAQMGIMDSEIALNMAYEAGLDLIEISPNANPAVCKIADFGKYKYEALKREKEAKKNQKITEVKEVRLSPNIEDNDFMTKVNTARKFLLKGNKVKLTIKFRGREVMYVNNSHTLLNRFVTELSDISFVEKQSKLEGKNLSLILAVQK